MAAFFAGVSTLSTSQKLTSAFESVSIFLNARLPVHARPAVFDNTECDQ